MDGRYLCPQPQVERKSIPEITADLARLQQLAAAGKLTAEDLSGGSLTISNIGGREGRGDQTHCHSCLLGVGAGRRAAHQRAHT